MGNSLGNLSSSSSNQRISDVTREKVMELFYVLRANPKVSINKIDGLLCIIPKNENILCVTDSSGYNILQKTVSLNHIEIVRWILSRSNVDVNRGSCSLPLHIACYKGYKELVEMMVHKYRARVDLEFRMCWPGPHHINCEQRSHNCITLDHHLPRLDRSSDKLQNAIYYAIDGDHPIILDMLLQKGDETWLPWYEANFRHQKRPLLHVACERGAWACVQFLINERGDEINQLFDEYFPIHHAVLHDVKFSMSLLAAGALATVRTATENMSALHVLFYRKRGSAEDALITTKLLLDHGMREMINEPDSLGNTVLHTIIVRYALEESRFSLYQEYTPWTKWDVLHLVRYLLQQGARPSINQAGNSALACVLRHVRDWEFRYELLSMLLQEGGDPNVVGRDGSVPLMVCLVPLINKDLLHNFTHNMKVFYLNCIRILLKHGAQVNCSSRTHLTPLHVLMFAASEYMGLMQSEEKRASFEFIRQLLELLLSWGLNPNIALGGSRTQHILLSLLELVNLVRNPSDLDYVFDLTLTLIQHGANVDIDISMPDMICHSQSSFFLKKSSNKVLYYYIQWLCKKEHLLLDPEKRFAKIIKLYAMCMNHRALYTTLKLLHTQSAIVPVRTSLCSTLKELYTKPRSLMSQCRLVIYRSLQRSPGKYISKLTLPPPLVKYLMGFE
ncbi:ankyrin-3 [Folsomia candida]|uniref:ankyrin-3 n=1 Tax=Folsomia candida TaxID=158441 RepID=UPI000B905965|nr:ankyrin-3 [Folsomia candida]